MTAGVPFNDLHAQYLTLKSEIDAAIQKVIETSGFIRGPEVDSFERAFADLMGVQNCVSCSDGTTALYIAMRALGVKPGDEVIVPGMSWISTSETVSQAGATVRFCDIDPETHVMDPRKLSEAITPRTVGVIPVHLYGHPAPMPEIMEIARRNGLWVIEDCAQAHLATIGGQTVGTFGDIATFSFYPGKNLGAMGDAGAILTGDDGLASHMAMFARHGGLRKGDHQIEGINSRLDGLQAAILNVKLPHLTRWTERRREIAAEYLERLGGLPGLTLPRVAAGANPVWHLFVLLVDRRDAFVKGLADRGIQTVLNYPRALPFLPCYAGMGATPGDYPNSHRLQEMCVSIPIFPEMTGGQIDLVCRAIEEHLELVRV
jgi:dTDP-4-amino-4,6-dideoxygalactose transaminase